MTMTTRRSDELTAADEAFTAFLRTVNPVTIHGELVRDGAALLDETPGCALDRDRQEMWAFDNRTERARQVAAADRNDVARLDAAVAEQILAYRAARRAQHQDQPPRAA